MKSPSKTGYYHALIDSSTSRLLTIDRNISTIQTLRECTPNSSYVAYFHTPKITNLFSLLFTYKLLKSENYSSWIWDKKFKIFIRDKKETPNNYNLVQKAKVAETKRRLITEIINKITIARFNISNHLLAQEIIYLTKRNQAQRFKDFGYNDTLILEFPYVLQYADYANISLKQAADDILLKSKFSEEKFAKTELLRITYLNKIKKTSSTHELKKIYDEFERVYYLNALI